MAWEISIKQEGWQELHKQCHLQDKETLAKGLADYNYETFHGTFNKTPNPHHKGYWNWKKLVTLPHDILADAVYKCIETVNTCDNGGFKYWIDWEGYHTITLPD